MKVHACLSVLEISLCGISCKSPRPCRGPSVPCAAGATPGCNTRHPVSMMPTAATRCRDWYSEASQPGKKKGVWVWWRKAFKGIEVCTVMFSWYQKLGMWKKHPSKRRSRCQGSEAAGLSFTVPVAEPGASHYIRNTNHKLESLHTKSRGTVVSTAAMY